jgi:hypothetical protein
MAIDPELARHATPTQIRYWEAREEYGSATAAEKALGLGHDVIGRAIRTLENNAARRGYAPGHFASGTAPGYQMGKVTVQRSADGSVERVWERQHPGANNIIETIRAAVDDITNDLKGALPTIAAPKTYDVDLFTLIPMGDPHFGLMTWAKEVGENFDLKIAEELTFSAVDRLCAMTPASDTAMLLNLGDFFHADNSRNATPQNGNPLDVDGRFQLIAQVGIRAMVRCIRRLLEKHAKVIVRNNRGNHDPHQSFMLSLVLDAAFQDNPRVHIELTPASFFYYRFGRTLMGSTHGDGPKMTELPSIMANDVPAEWAAAKWRVWHCGHVHHDQVKDLVGCRVETHRSLAANDAWHRQQGYHSERDMKAIIYHREHGEVSRIRCGLSMLEEASA